MKTGVEIGPGLGTMSSVVQATVYKLRILNLIQISFMSEAILWTHSELLSGNRMSNLCFLNLGFYIYFAINMINIFPN